MKQHRAGRAVHGVNHCSGCAPHRMAGVTYVEVLVAMLLIVTTLIPAMDALRTGTLGSAIHETSTWRHFQLAALLEEVLAEPFTELDDEAVAINDPAVASDNYSDPAGQANRRLVYLSRYDADNADGNGDFFDVGMDEGLIWVRVELEGTAQDIESLTSVYD